MVQSVKYIPKESMCKKCRFENQSSDGLPFNLYQIYEERDNYTVVICHEYFGVKDGR